MGHMKWIYTMIQDNSYLIFKELTEEMGDKKETFLIWNDSKLDIEYCKCVVQFVENKGMPDYDRFLTSETEREPDIDYEG